MSQGRLRCELTGVEQIRMRQRFSQHAHANCLGDS